MSKTLKTQKGFTAVEGLLTLLILVVLGGIGYMVYHNNHKTKTVDTSASAAKSSTTKSNKSAPTTLSNSALVMQKQKYIDSYIIANTNKSWTASYYTPIYQSGYLSTKIYNVIQSEASDDNDLDNSSANPAYDELICINEIPSSYTYGTVTVKGTTAQLPINVYVSGSTTPTPFTANWVKTNGAWQLNGSACSQE